MVGESEQTELDQPKEPIVSGEVTPDNRTPNLEDELLAWSLGGGLLTTTPLTPVVPKTLFEDGAGSPESLDEGQALRRLELLE